MPITKRLNPYQISSQLQLRARDPYDPTDEDLDLSWLARPDATDDELLTMDLSNSSALWKELRIDLEVTIPAAELERVLPPPSSPEHDAALIVSMHCPATKLREATLLQYVGGRWTGDIVIRRAQTRRQVTIVPQLVRTTDLPINWVAAADVARERNFLIAEGRAVSLTIDPMERPLQGVLRTSWDDFRTSVDPWRKQHDDDVYYLELDAREPTLWLNSAHHKLKAALHGQSRHGGDAVIRHLGNALIAQTVWMQLFMAAVGGLSRNEETNAVERPDEAWKQSVLATLTSVALPGLTDVEQLRRLEDLRSPEHAGALAALISSAAQGVVKTHQLIKRAIGAAERIPDLQES